jgi:UDPglucose--hexose-1-phosphate uridylyltransferase
MSELRFNELRGEEVAYAIHRQERTFLPTREHCPLCPTRPGGPATEIPAESFEIVVFENRFPAFEEPNGAAEVVVYTDDHDLSLGSLPASRAEALMWVWRERYEELGVREEIDYVYVFENRGVEVGVTLHHPHGQIYGYPFLPPVPALELAADARLGGCAVCRLNEAELADGRRLIHEDEHVVTYVPRAARWPYEAHVCMREHRRSLSDCEPRELKALAGSLQHLVRGFDALFSRPFPYVMAVHQEPTRSGERLGGHLHAEFYPPLRTAEKLKYPAGSEQGAGTFISDVLPEESAEHLRAALARAG